MLKSNILKFDIEHIYIYSVVLAFGLLFFANADQQVAPDGTVVELGIGKLFYVPCAIALICSQFLVKKKDKLDKKLRWLIIIAISTSIIHPPNNLNFLTWTLTRFIFAILCFKDIRNINPILFAKCVVIASPLIVFPHYILTDPLSYGDWRYGGFYGDANFLALALNIIIVLCYITFMKTDNKLLKIICIASTLGSIPLIMAGMSRGGIIGLLIILFFILRSLQRTNKKLFFFIIIIGVLSIGSFTSKFGDLIDRIEYRFSGESSSDQGGARARLESIESVCNVMIDCPYLIPTGIGLGNTMHDIEKYRQHGYYSRFVVHNTYFSLFYEAGLIVLLLYLSIYLYIFKNLYAVKNYLLLGIIFSGTLSLFTLPGVSFMPGWIMLFLLSNKKIEMLTIT